MPLGEEKQCSICPVSPPNTPTLKAVRAAHGCVLTLPARSAMTAVVPAAATCCATCLRHSAPDFVCARVPLQGDLPFVRVRARNRTSTHPTVSTLALSRRRDNTGWVARSPSELRLNKSLQPQVI